MQRTFWLLATLLCGVGLLLAFQQTRLSINGKETRDFVVSNGKVYVAVAALRDAGAVVTNNQNPNAEVGEADKLLIQFRSTGGKPALKGFRIFLRESTRN